MTIRQSKKGSMAEVLANLGIGYTLNLGVNLIILPYYFGSSISMAKNIEMGIVYTVFSILRSYGLRRLFNHFNWFSKVAP